MFNDSTFPINFWIKAIDISNHLQNNLFIKYYKYTLIPKKPWTENRQNIQYFLIFGYKVNIFIQDKKCTKSNIYNAYREIFINYKNTSKYV